jgi:hypothetical protein
MHELPFRLLQALAHEVRKFQQMQEKLYDLHARMLE